MQDEGGNRDRGEQSAKIVFVVNPGQVSDLIGTTGESRRAGEVLVSTTVKDLVAGSRIDFVDMGEHELKGVPGFCRLYRAVP